MNDLKNKIKLDESTVSMILGALVVIVIGLLIYNTISSRKSSQNETGSEDVIVTTPTPPQKIQTGSTYKGALPAEHVVTSGEDLWTIATYYFGSGYNWVDIASANNLTDPGLIFAGMKLTIPNTKAITVTGEVSAINTITGNTYTIIAGDDLWDIAVRAYGDGYRWTDIAKANNLTDPNLIHTGNVLTIPR